MRILALDTSTEACSAALWLAGEVHERYEVAPRQHTRLILPMIQALLAEAQLQLTQLDAIAFARGPGSFTGIRVATGVVQGLALGSDRPVVPVSTLAALAQGCIRLHRAERVCVVMDARMQEVYWANYHCQQDSPVAMAEESVCTPTQVQLPPAPCWAIGTGWQSYADALPAPPHLATAHLPHAQDIASLAAVQCQQGDAVAAWQAQPVYLRNKVTG